MKARPSIDMSEAMRLTRAGRLSEALAMLRGSTSGASSPVAPADSGDIARNAPPEADPSTNDIAPPASPGGAPRAPAHSGSRPATRWPAGILSLATRRELPKAMRALVNRFDRPDPRPGLDGLPASLRIPSPTIVPRGARFEERAFSNEAGGIGYKLYVPSGCQGEPAPLVVMLHGCTQSPDDFAAGTRMNELAEEQLFLVAYPGQTHAANPSKCWNWFRAGDQQRDQGEPSLIAGVTRQIIDDFRVDPRRVYIAGLSAGGAAAAIMGSAYPDLYAAVGVHSGLACGAARDMPSAFAAMRQGGAPPPRAKRGDRASRFAVPTIVFHGDGDNTVHPVNADHVIAQAKAERRLVLAVSRGKAPGGMDYTRTVQTDEGENPVLEQWVLHGAGHAWSGGSSAGTYTDPRGPDASREMLRFFRQHANSAAAPGKDFATHASGDRAG
jgi:poly(hydroxyalkanoate) depolymerase family esterase